MTKIVVFISGRGSNFIALNEAIKSGYIKDAVIVAVFCNNPDAAGISYAGSQGIPVIMIPSKGRKDRELYDREVLESLKPHKPDLICLAGYMRIVTAGLVSAFENRIMNIHPALLPSFPGLDAQKQALDYGVKFSGCTVHFVDCGMDSGAIILQAVVTVFHDDTPETLSARILEEEHKLYPEAVKLFSAGRLKIDGRRVEIKD